MSHANSYSRDISRGFPALDRFGPTTILAHASIPMASSIVFRINVLPEPDGFLNFSSAKSISLAGAIFSVKYFTLMFLSS